MTTTLRRVPLPSTTSPSLVLLRPLTLNQGSDVASQSRELRRMVQSMRVSGARKTSVLTASEQVPLPVTEACGWSNHVEVGATMVVSAFPLQAMTLKGWRTPDSGPRQPQRANNLGELSLRLEAAFAPLRSNSPSPVLRRSG